MNNIAFIDGQNLHMGTKYAEDPWNLDFVKFSVYLKEKYKVNKAYYFLGFINTGNQDFYNEIQQAGFVLIFKKHNMEMMSKKKGNVDSDVIFLIMKKLYLREKFDKIVLVSGDGDYKNLVDFLIQQKKFHKILFPNIKFASSLYKKLEYKYYARLNDEYVKSKIKKDP